MEAKGLMIGDWVRHFNGTPMQVTRIDYTQSGGHFACGTPHCWEYNNKFESIPLTSELLEENGFERVPQPGCSNPYYWKLKQRDEDGELLYRIEAYNTPFRGMFIQINNPSDCASISFCKQIEHVHELQHALRLCDIDTEIAIKED